MGRPLYSENGSGTTNKDDIKHITNVTQAFLNWTVQLHEPGLRQRKIKKKPSNGESISMVARVEEEERFILSHCVRNLRVARQFPARSLPWSFRLRSCVQQSTLQLSESPPPKMSVARGRLHLEDAVLDRQVGNVESVATHVVDQHLAFAIACVAQSVRNRCCSRFTDVARHMQTQVGPASLVAWRCES